MVCGWDKKVNSIPDIGQYFLNFPQGPGLFYVDSDGTRMSDDLFSVGCV